MSLHTGGLILVRKWIKMLQEFNIMNELEFHFRTKVKEEKYSRIKALASFTGHPFH